MDGLSLNQISKTIKEELKNNNTQVEEILLKEKEIADCLGCFKCWVKTPGICIIDDYGRETAAKVIKALNLIAENKDKINNDLNGSKKPKT